MKKRILIIGAVLLAVLMAAGGLIWAFCRPGVRVWGDMGSANLQMPCYIYNVATGEFLEDSTLRWKQHFRLEPLDENAGTAWGTIAVEAQGSTPLYQCRQHFFVDGYSDAPVLEWQLHGSSEFLTLVNYPNGMTAGDEPVIAGTAKINFAFQEALADGSGTLHSIPGSTHRFWYFPDTQYVLVDLDQDSDLVALAGFADRQEALRWLQQTGEGIIHN